MRRHKQILTSQINTTKIAKYLLLVLLLVAMILPISVALPSYNVVSASSGNQTFFPIDPVEVTPETINGWVDVNGADFGVPTGATGILLHCVATSAVTDYAFGLRMNGSTDNRIDAIPYNTHCWAAIGVDANIIFEAYVGSTTNIDIYIVGYTMAGVTFFTNAYDKSLTNTSVWEGIDCSAEAPDAVGLIFEIVGDSSASYKFGLRKNNSTDARTTYVGLHSGFGFIIGCDTDQICEGTVNNITVGLYLVGYITDGATFNTNATNLSLNTTDTWLDLSALPADSIMGFIELYYDSKEYGLRKNGSSEEIYHRAYHHPCAFVECDADHIIEGKIETTTEDFFLIGYATKPPPVPPVPPVPIGNTLILISTATFLVIVVFVTGIRSEDAIATLIVAMIGVAIYFAIKAILG